MGRHQNKWELETSTVRFSDPLNVMVWFSLRFYDFLRGVSPYFSKYSIFSEARNFWWVNLKLMKLIYLKSALKCNAFDVTIIIKIPFFRISVTIDPGHSLLHFAATNCLISTNLACFLIILKKDQTAKGNKSKKKKNQKTTEEIRICYSKTGFSRITLRIRNFTIQFWREHLMFYRSMA